MEGGPGLILADSLQTYVGEFDLPAFRQIPARHDDFRRFFSVGLFGIGQIQLVTAPGDLEFSDETNKLPESLWFQGGDVILDFQNSVQGDMFLDTIHAQG